MVLSCILDKREKTHLFYIAQSERNWFNGDNQWYILDEKLWRIKLHWDMFDKTNTFKILNRPQSTLCLKMKIPTKSWIIMYFDLSDFKYKQL